MLEEFSKPESLARSRVSLVAFTMIVGGGRRLGLRGYQARVPAREAGATTEGMSMEPSSPSVRQSRTLDCPSAAASRIALVAAHAARVLKITHPYVSDSGRWEATWTGGGSASADTEDELLADVAARLGPA